MIPTIAASEGFRNPAGSDQSRIAAGKIALEQGRPVEALAVARRAAEAAGVKPNKEGSAEANALAVLAMGKSSQAAALNNTTEKVLPAVQDQVALLREEIVLAQAGAAAKAANRAGAERKPGTIVRRASRAGLAGVAMDARFAESRDAAAERREPGTQDSCGRAKGCESPRLQFDCPKSIRLSKVRFLAAPATSIPPPKGHSVVTTVELAYQVNLRVPLPPNLLHPTDPIPFGTGAGQAVLCLRIFSNGTRKK
jgi:hypothetical protein